MKAIWKTLAIFFLGLAAGLAVAFKLKRPETVINQKIGKLKQRGESNQLQVEMKTESRKDKRLQKRAKRLLRKVSFNKPAEK